jgi:putative transcriptional regulator
MNAISRIRIRLGVTQAAMAQALDVTQGNVSLYEKGQTVPPRVARHLITYARSLGHEIGFDDIYADIPQGADRPVEVEPAEQGA